MNIKLITASALAVVLAAGCASEQKMEKAEPAAPSAKAAAPAKAKPKLMTGASGSMLANTCTGCHGTNGLSSGPATPTIAGLETDYFIDVMEAYKSDERVNTIMGRIAKGYSDEEIEQMADHYAKHPFQGVIQTSVGPKARRGRELHANYCEKCHEDGGTSIEDTPLAGQWMPYIHWTIADYLDGHNNPEKKMNKAIDKMMAEHPGRNRAQLAEDLANYYGSQR